MEISRWSSEANTTGSPVEKEHPPGRGGGTRAPRAPAGAHDFFDDVIRWCSLATLARPPANFLPPSGWTENRIISPLFRYAPFHLFRLFRYLDEQTYRFNERKGDDQARRVDAVKTSEGSPPDVSQAHREVRPEVGAITRLECRNSSGNKRGLTCRKLHNMPQSSRAAYSIGIKSH